MFTQRYFPLLYITEGWYLLGLLVAVGVYVVWIR